MNTIPFSFTSVVRLKPKLRELPVTSFKITIQPTIIKERRNQLKQPKMPQKHTYEHDKTHNLTTSSKSFYLHPTDRVLQSTQIGHSGHRNSYNTGVLDDNWQEDRALYDRAYSMKPEFTQQSTTHFMHDAKTPIPNHVANNNVIEKHTHPRDTEVNHYVSLNQMTYGAGLKTENTFNLHGTSLQHEPVNTLTTGSQGVIRNNGAKTTDIRLSSSLRHKRSGSNEPEETHNEKEETLTTTYRAMMGNVSPSNETTAKRPTKIWGESTKGLDDPSRKMDLRGTFPLKLTPMNK